MSIRHAPYDGAPPDFAIGLSPIGAADWLEGGETDPAARKDPLFAKSRDVVFGELEGSRAGQAEVLGMVEAAVGAKGDLAPPPLQAAARLVPDDLCLMEKRGGAWTLTAVSLSAGTFFTAADALGKDLSALHGPVPGFGDALLPRVARIFEGLRPDLILQRRNWTVVDTAELHTPVRTTTPAITDPGAGLFVRVERQTLRRLPATGGALFTIRVWVHPLAALRDDPERLAAFAGAWRAAAPAFRDYKKLHLYDALVEAFLAQA